MFEAAHAMPVNERPAYLASVWGSDGGLRGEVESLLASHHLVESFLERPASVLLADDAIHLDVIFFRHLGPRA